VSSRNPLKSKKRTKNKKKRQRKKGDVERSGLEQNNTCEEQGKLKKTAGQDVDRKQ